MPIYAFACDACGHRFDRLQKLSDADPADCPGCGAQGRIRRQVTAPAFRLAGSGWYETDFKSGREKKHNLAGDSGSGAAGEGGGASSPAESGKPKPAAAEQASAKPATAAKPGAAGKGGDKGAGTPA